MFGHGVLAHRVGIQILHRSRAERPPGHPNPALGVAAPPGVRPDPAANGADAHTSGRHPAAAAGQGGWSAGGARVPRVAVGRRPHHRVRAHPLPQPVRVHEDRGEGEGVLPQRGHPLDHHSAGVHRAALRQLQAGRGAVGGLRAGLPQDGQPHVRVVHVLRPLQAGNVPSTCALCIADDGF